MLTWEDGGIQPEEHVSHMHSWTMSSRLSVSQMFKTLQCLNRLYKKGPQDRSDPSLWGDIIIEDISSLVPTQPSRQEMVWWTKAYSLKVVGTNEIARLVTIT